MTVKNFLSVKFGKEKETTQFSLIQDFKKELKDYEKQIKENILTKSEKDSLELSFAKWLLGLKNNIKHLSPEVQKKYEEVMKKLSDPNVDLKPEDIHFIIELLDSFSKQSKEIESDYLVQLDKTDLAEMKESIKEIRERKKELNSLKWSIGVKTDIKKVTQLSEKAKKYVEQLKVFEKEHPYWTKALMMLIPKEILATFFKTEKDDDNFWKMGKVMETIAKNNKKIDTKEITQMLKQFKWWVTSILVFLFDWIAPKEMREFLANVKKDFWNLSERDLLLVKSKLGGGVVNINTVVKESKEWIEWEKDKIQKILDSFVVKTQKTVKRFANKDISQQEARKLVEKMKIKELLEENTENVQSIYERMFWDPSKAKLENPNDLAAGLEIVSLPFRFFYRMVSVLHKEGYIKLSDILVYFKDKSVDVVLWTLWLLWGTKSILSGEIPTDKLVANLKEMMNEDPSIGKEVLAIILYRHGWIVFSTIANLVEFMGKSVIYGLTWETNVIKNFVDLYKWNVNEYVRVLKKLANEVPEADKWGVLKNLIIEIEQMENAGNFLSIFNENRTKNPNMKVSELITEYENKFWKSFPFKADEFINEPITSRKFRAEVAKNISNIWKSTENTISKLSAWLSSFKWMAWEQALLKEYWEHMKSVSAYLGEMILNDNIFSRLYSKYKNFEKFLKVAQFDELYNKGVFRFSSIEKANDFFKELWALAKESPTLVKNIIWKIPIISVVWFTAATTESKEEMVKNMAFLFPLIWEGYMVYDAMYNWKEDLTQATLWSVLFATSSGYIIYQLTKKDFRKIWKFLLWPLPDIWEIITFLSKTWFTATKVAWDALKLIKNWRFSIKELSKLIEFKFPKLHLKFSKLWKVWILLIIIFWGLDLAFASDEWAKEEIEKYKKECGDNINCIDNKIRQDWFGLDNETKGQFLSLSVYLKTGYYCDVKYKNWQFVLLVSEKNKAVPNYLFLERVKLLLQETLNRWWDNTKVSIIPSIELIRKIKKENNLHTREEFYNYLSALTYPKDIIEKIEEKLDKKS